MKVLIIANGDLKDIDVTEYYYSADKIICADGGARHLYNEGLMPDIIIGDLDSIDGKTLDEYQKQGVDFIKHPINKSKSDTDLALDYAIENGADEIVLLGATGSRLDHSLANILILYRLASLNINARIIDKHNEVFITKDTLKIDNKQDHFVSVIPLIDSKVTLKGFKYDTSSVEFKLGSTLGISNEVEDNEALIKVESGICLVIRSRD